MFLAPLVQQLSQVWRADTFSGGPGSNDAGVCVAYEYPVVDAESRCVSVGAQVDGPV